MSNDLNPRVRLIGIISNRGVSYNNDLIDEFFSRYIEWINSESINDKSDEELMELTRENWVQAYVYGIYSFAGKKVVIDSAWKVDKELFEYNRDQFEEAYRDAALGFGQMVGDTMSIIIGPRPHLRIRMVDFVENVRLKNELIEEAKIRATKNPHAGIPNFNDI